GEARPGVASTNALCPPCARSGGVRRLYESRPYESPLWTAHLLRLRRRAEAELPLFDDTTDSPRNVNRGRRFNQNKGGLRVLPSWPGSALRAANAALPGVRRGRPRRG